MSAERNKLGGSSVTNLLATMLKIQLASSVQFGTMMTDSQNMQQAAYHDTDSGESMPALRQRGSKGAGFTLVEVMIVVAIIGLLAAIAIPNFMKARKRSQATTTLEDVRLIDAAKNQFALENRKPGDFVPKVADIKPYLQVGSRLYNNTPLTNFRDIFGNPIAMGDLNTPPLIDDATRDMFSDVIPDNKAFWGTYCR